MKLLAASRGPVAHGMESVHAEPCCGARAAEQGAEERRQSQAKALRCPSVSGKRYAL